MNIESLGTPDAPTFGLDTFGDLGRDPAAGPDGPLVGHPESIRLYGTEVVPRVRELLA